MLCIHVHMHSYRHVIYGHIFFAYTSIMFIMTIGDAGDTCGHYIAGLNNIFGVALLISQTALAIDYSDLR